MSLHGIEPGILQSWSGLYVLIEDLVSCIDLPSHTIDFSTVVCELRIKWSLVNVGSQVSTLRFGHENILVIFTILLTRMGTLLTNETCPGAMWPRAVAWLVLRSLGMW